MRISTELQLFLTYVALLLALALVMSVGAEAMLRPQLVRSLETDLRRELAVATQLYDRADEITPDSAARLIGETPERRVTIIDPQGRLLGEWPELGPAEILLDDFRVRPEIQGALETGQGRTIRRDPATNAQVLFLAQRTERGDVLRLGRPLAAADAAVTTVQRGVFGAAALGLLLAALLAFGFGLVVMRPLARVGDAARALAAGDLSRRVRLRRDDELGDLSNALNSLADELERRLGQLEGERAEMHALIDAMSEGVLAISPVGTLRRANPAARRMFSLPARPEGLTPEVISRRPEFRDLVHRALSGETVPPKELVGGGTSLLGTAHPLPDGGAVLVFLDVSELRRLEEVRRDFVANASHELKTPLTAIRGYSETLAEPDLPPDLVRRFAGTVKANADRLQRLVDDLLDLSRIEAGGWEIHPEDLSIEEVAQEAWPTEAAAAKRIGLRLELADGHASVRADPGALRQVMSNLFGNALRYTPPEGSIAVRSRPLTAAEGRRRPGRINGERWTVVEVEDTGTGIPSAHLSRVFERFYRVDPARSREEGGTGLGLSIVKHLVESHGGWIEAESQVGTGTIIRFALPAPADEK